MAGEAVTLQGFLGWGNRKNGLEPYGPGGRWHRGATGQRGEGDLLGDALEREGASEGSDLIVVAIPRFYGGNVETMKAATARVHAAVLRTLGEFRADLAEMGLEGDEYE